jgi:hypothetical protein
VPATIVDHIVPLAMGGPDTDDNTQPLCGPCHASKTALEDASHKGVLFHPDWLKRSAIPLEIVCGPAGAGKSTYCKQHAAPEDIVIDMDYIGKAIDPAYDKNLGMSDALLSRAIRARNEMLGSLSRRTIGRAWFIIAAPTEQERTWWQAKLGGHVVLLDPGADECKRRCIARGTPDAVARVDRWYDKATLPWRGPSGRRTQYKDNGYPVWPTETRGGSIQP